MRGEVDIAFIPCPFALGLTVSVLKWGRGCTFCGVRPFLQLGFYGGAFFYSVWHSCVDVVSSGVELLGFLKQWECEREGEGRKVSPSWFLVVTWGLVPSSLSYQGSGVLRFNSVPRQVPFFRWDCNVLVFLFLLFFYFD